MEHVYSDDENQILVIEFINKYFLSSYINMRLSIPNRANVDKTLTSIYHVLKNDIS